MPTSAITTFGNGEAWQMIGPHAAFCILIG